MNCVTVIKDYFIQIDFEPWFKVDQIMFNETALDPMYQITGDTFLRMKVDILTAQCKLNFSHLVLEIAFYIIYYIYYSILYYI